MTAMNAGTLEALLMQETPGACSDCKCDADETRHKCNAGVCFNDEANRNYEQQK